MARITKSQLIRLQKKYHTDARIGEEFDITRQAVHQLRKKFNIPSRTAGNPQRNNDMVTMRKAGKSVEAIARKFKLSIPQTYRILKDFDSLYTCVTVPSLPIYLQKLSLLC